METMMAQLICVVEVLMSAALVALSVWGLAQ